MDKALEKTTLPAELHGLLPAGSYSFDQLYRLAQVCHASGLFEDVADAAQAMIKIVRGQEMGIPPTAAMSAFDIVKKRVFIKPWAIAAKINASGYGSYRVVEQTPERCTIQFARRYAGQGWQECSPVTYTLAEAKAHGLIENSRHWKASPAHMLYQRAMGRGGAMYFPELLAGLEAPPDDTPIPPERHRQNIVDLFGQEPDDSPTLQRTPTPPPEASQEAMTIDTVTGEILDPEPPAWRGILAEARADDALPEPLRSKVRLALKAGSETSDEKGEELARQVQDWQLAQDN